MTDNADPLLRRKKGRQAATDLSSHISAEIRVVNDQASTFRHQTIELADGSNDKETHEEGDNNASPYRIDIDDESEDELHEFIFKTNQLFSHTDVEQLMKQWNTSIYAFFKPIPIIDHIDGQHAHIFECNAKTCIGKGKNGRQVRRYLNMADATFTSNLRWHTKICWGQETVEAAGSTNNISEACAVLRNSILKDGSITAAFEGVGKGKVTFSHRQHTKAESR
jgi:hypothetical protein